MLKLNSKLVETCDSATQALRFLEGVTKTQACAHNVVWASDYFCWLHNALLADYATITFLFKTMQDIESFDLRPIYCIIRSSLEKYADILNLYTYGSRYAYYLMYLSFYSSVIYLKNCQRTNHEDILIKEKQRDEARQNFFNNFAAELHTKICNRKTRYFLLWKANALSILNEQDDICAFNKEISQLDSKYSQILHNNAEYHPQNNLYKTQEILRYVHYMMFVSLRLFPEYYRTMPYVLQITSFPATNPINGGLGYLSQAIQILRNNEGVLYY